MLRVIIAGGRDFNDYALLSRVVSKFLAEQSDTNIEIVSGGAQGADALGERYAQENHLPVTRYPANWQQYGKAAGHIRNKQMADHANALVAFWVTKRKPVIAQSNR